MAADNFNSMGEWAEFYAGLGWPVVPLCSAIGAGCSCGKADCPSPGKHPDGRLVHTGLKEATSDIAVVKAWWAKSPDANIGIRTGEAFDVLDIDGDDGKAWLVEMEAQHGPLDGHMKARSGKGGYHFFFKPTGLGNTTGIDGRKVDYRGVNGYIIVAPSYTVGPYAWLHKRDMEPAEAPSWVIAKLAARKQRESIANPGTGLVPSGQRNDALTSMAGSLVNRGITGEPLRQALHELNQTLLEEPLEASEVDSIAKSATGFSARVEPYKPGDTGNAEWFASVKGHLVRYDHSRKAWYIFHESSGAWKKDDDAHIYRLWVASARERLEYAASLPEQDDREKEAKSALGMESTKKRMDDGLAIAASLKPISTNGKEWDTGTLILGCTNGLVDLTTGALRPGKPSDMVTLSTGLAYDPEAKAPRWEQFLDEVFGGDAELISWLQKAAGYSATGMTSEEVVFFAYGVGSNGKSRFLEAIKTALGTYSYTMEMRALEADYKASVSNDIASLRGKRFVTASESNDGTNLNTAKLKALTGSEEVNARMLYREAEPFRPQLSMWLGVNHRPGIPDDSNGIWRRIRLVPFEVIFDTTGDPLWTGPRADDRLEEKLVAEAPGILRWVVEGAVRWYKEGLKPAPARVMAATDSYRGEQDYLTGFIRDKVVIDGSTEKVRAQDLYGVFSDWWDSEGMPRTEKPSGVKFGQSFKDRMRVLSPGFTDNRDSQGRFYTGFSLSYTPQEEALRSMPI